MMLEKICFKSFINVVQARHAAPRSGGIDKCRDASGETLWRKHARKRTQGLPRTSGRSSFRSNVSPKSPRALVNRKKFEEGRWSCVWSRALRNRSIKILGTLRARCRYRPCSAASVCPVNGLALGASSSASSARLPSSLTMSSYS